MLNRLKHSAHLPVPSLVNRDGNGRVFLFRIDIVIFHLSGGRHSVLQHDPVLQLVQSRAMRDAFDRSQISLRHMMLRMSQQMGKFAIIG
ncbi:hypothetical protein D1872_289500 [compost metagenome]